MPLIVYATDEDLALRASSDYFILCPKDQKIASGEDGQISGGDRWTLSSPSVDFRAQGVRRGQVVHLTKPLAAFRAPGETFAVESVGPGTVTLRRKGQEAGIGQPPAPSQGVTGVEFSVVTFDPQIDSATFDINRRFGIDESHGGRSASSLADPRELRDAVILTVLHRQYLELSREVGANRDTFAAKAFAVRAELDEVLARMAVHFLSTPGSSRVESVTRFQTRISR